jgi:hypothetical protein
VSIFVLAKLLKINARSLSPNHKLALGSTEQTPRGKSQTADVREIVRRIEGFCNNGDSLW